MAREEPGQEIEILPPASAVPQQSLLSPPQLQAAVADAAGATRSEIAHVARVSESTVKQWRQRPEYQAEVARLKSAQVEVLHEPIVRLKEDFANGARDAVKSLRAALDAVDAEGREAWSIRLEAAKELMKAGIDLTNSEAKAAAEAARASHANVPITPIQINIDTTKGPPDVADFQ